MNATETQKEDKYKVVNSSSKKISWFENLNSSNYCNCYVDYFIDVASVDMAIWHNDVIHDGILPQSSGTIFVCRIMDNGNGCYDVPCDNTDDSCFQSAY